MAPMMDYASDRSPERSPTPPRHDFTVTSAIADDIPRLVDIEFYAFENEQVNQVLSYRDHNNPAHFGRAVDAYTTTLRQIQSMNMSRKPMSISRRARQFGTGKSSAQLLKVIEASSGEIVSFTKTETKSYSVQELQSPADVGHENEPQMNRDWFALNERMRRDYMGQREHCYIGMLATQPRHQHRGAGTLLLSTILHQADVAGIEVYLEGTDTAKPLYEKHGFRALKELRFEPSKYGVTGLGVEKQTVMVRGAMGEDGVRKEPRAYHEAAAESAAQFHATNY